MAHGVPKRLSIAIATDLRSYRCCSLYSVLIVSEKEIARLNTQPLVAHVEDMGSAGVTALMDASYEFPILLPFRAVVCTWRMYA